jgi:diguanylate cyclase (GGDEF)-like protein
MIRATANRGVERKAVAAGDDRSLRGTDFSWPPIEVISPSGVETLRKLAGTGSHDSGPVDFSGQDLETLFAFVRWAEDEVRDLRERERRRAMILENLETRLARRNSALRKAKAGIKAHLETIESLQELVLRDPLTGMHNRRFWLEASKREFSRAVRDNAKLSVIAIDIDNFKRVNDSYGHKRGDEVLVFLGDLIRRSIRQTDVACRVGGEEFILALPASSLEDTCKRAEAIRLEFERAAFEFDGRKVRLSFSAGVATFPDHGKTIDDVALCADRALYMAKNAGRNRVVRWP